VIPEWMDDEDAVLLTDALATGYFGAQLGDSPKDSGIGSCARALTSTPGMQQGSVVPLCLEECQVDHAQLWHVTKGNQQVA
jgi:hypothetical protein